ncbi:MAG: helix-turn-helix domain-containing protein [Planctomycetaceae bacterium]
MTKVGEYVKVAEAAVILGVSENTVRAWADGGKLPVHRNPANGYRLFSRSELQKFLTRLERQPKAQRSRPR